MKRTALVTAALACLAGASPASAAGITLTVSGDSVYSECGAAKSATYSTELSGSLVGCMATFVQSVTCDELNGFAYSVELGREEFDGTLDGKAIKFGTIYTFEALWPSGSCPTPAPEAEIAGGCDHYISGEGVSGLIKFYDIIPTVGKGATNFLYQGVLHLSDGATAAIAPLTEPAVDVADAKTPRPATEPARTFAC